MAVALTDGEQISKWENYGTHHYNGTLSVLHSRTDLGRYKKKSIAPSLLREVLESEPNSLSRFFTNAAATQSVIQSVITNVFLFHP